MFQRFELENTCWVLIDSSFTSRSYPNESLFKFAEREYVQRNYKVSRNIYFIIKSYFEDRKDQLRFEYQKDMAKYISYLCNDGIINKKYKSHILNIHKKTKNIRINEKVSITHHASG